LFGGVAPSRKFAEAYSLIKLPRHADHKDVLAVSGPRIVFPNPEDARTLEDVQKMEEDVEIQRRIAAEGYQKLIAEGFLVSDRGYRHMNKADRGQSAIAN
jgi:hypothetical protein